MAIFSEKVKAAYYIDKDNIQILWEDGDVLIPHIITADEKHPDFKALKEEGWDLVKIADDTAEYKRAQSYKFNQRVNEVASDLVKQMMQDAESGLETMKPYRKGADGFNEESMNWFIHYFVENNNNPEEVFKLKLRVLEKIKDSPTEDKRAIRKAKTILDILKYYKKVGA
jgi:hypothetical protein